MQSIDVQLGQQVTAGDTLCVLADHCELYIEGTAFEADTPDLREAIEKGTPVSADILVSTRREEAVKVSSCCIWRTRSIASRGHCIFT